ncbi:hypothetical protein [Streptomyces yunnanensis]|uniref:DMSO/TMAO reductase YedYZ, heme-binding membrane subunit n=1 Tax=Streptomyces yunnanensis TaxID=156453 RepID=A0A9X8R0E5_9ACTN|nr:hypothetical protein [Streptomyces yunnanensis]SHN33389.1 hypothetical protein SAMN05216268_1399 [Streptomyces yunnanensis]
MPAPPPSSARNALLRPALPAALLLFLAVTLRSGAMDNTVRFLDHDAGVLALVSLSATVLWGLAATDRLVLHTPHRLLAQAVHRATGVAGLGFLGLHIGVKAVEGHTTATAAAVPFTDGARPLLIGCGTLAAYGFLTVAVSGAVRGAFAGRTTARWWWALHTVAYACWALALLHGLKSGRAAAGWAVAGYGMALAGVAVRLALRLRAPLRIPGGEPR